MSRWVRVSVDIFDHEFFASAEPFSEREAWLWLIANAAWRDTKHRVGNDMLDVPVGSLFATLRGLQSAWKWKSDKRVRSFLSRLENGRMVETKTDAGKTQITICNYSRFQEAGRKEDAARTQDGRSSDALKTPVHQDTNNTSSLRSDGAQALRKRAARLPEDWALPRAWGEWAIEQGFSEAQTRIEADKFRDYWISKGGKDAAKLDWEATWRNWMRNCSKPSGKPPPRKERTIFDAIDDFIRDNDDELPAGKTIDHDGGNSPSNVHLLAPATWRGR